jgi:2-(1,2-epoxy-1,2-dihydrophenyl)acetyl-CoA isomerase
VSAPALLVERRAGVAVLVLNRPQARNALDLALRDALEETLGTLAADAEVRALVVRGAGEHFCAGGDVKLMREGVPAAEGQARVEALNRAVGALARFRAPTVAMVDGAAVGAGCTLAIACDLVVASERARLGAVFARIGLIPDGGATHLLPRRVGLARAKELAFTGQVLDAAAALRIGLVDRVVPAARLEEEALGLAGALAAGPPRALALAKALLTDGLEVGLEESLRREAVAQAALLASSDHREGLAAFFERRPPRFTGR